MSHMDIERQNFMKECEPKPVVYSNGCSDEVGPTFMGCMPEIKKEPIDYLRLINERKLTGSFYPKIKTND